MLSKNILLNLFDTYNIVYNSEYFDKEYNELLNLKDITPFKFIELLLSRLSVTDYNVVHSSTSQIESMQDSSIIYLNNVWCTVNKQDDGTYFVVEPNTDNQSIFTLDEIPITVICWLQKKENKKTTNEKQPENIKQIIFNIFKKNPVWLVNIAIATIIINIFAVLSSMFAMQVYDRVVPTLALETLTSLSVGILIIYLVDWLLKLTRAKIIDVNSSVIDKKLSAFIYTRLLNIQLDKRPNQLGTLTAQINGLDSVRQFFSSTIVFSLVDMPFAIMFLCVIYLIGGQVAFVYGAFLFISLIIALIAQKRCKSIANNLVMRSNEKLGILVDTIQGGETIRSVGVNQTFGIEWDHVNDSISDYSLQQKRISTSATTTSQTLGQVCYVFAIVTGVYLISNGDMTMGSMIACSILGGRILGPVGQAVSHLVQYESVAQSMQMVNSFLEVPQQRKVNSETVYPDVRPSKIELSNIEFNYAEKDISCLNIPKLDIKQGERIALLGSIGSGKSTLLKLLAGLYKPSSGRIRVGEADLWELDPDYIANNVSYLPQNPNLFKGTLKSNLTLGREISDNKILSVINLLGLDKIAEQSEKGLELEIHEGGSGLSGGQKQLVTIGRLFVGNACIWLLDEPSASLDPYTQTALVKAINVRLRPSDILVFATHNPKLAMELGNRIIVMENGQIKNDSPASAVQLRKRETV